MFKIIEEIIKIVLVVIVVGFIAWFVSQQLMILVKISTKINEQRKEITTIKLENSQLKAEQEKIFKQFTVLTKLTDEQRKNLVATKLSERLSNTSGALDKLKNIMLQTPEKAIKLERLQIKQEAEFKVLENKISSLKDQFSTIQSLLYLMVGFIITLLVYIWRKTHLETKTS